MIDGTPVVVDASVALKWVVDEPGSAAAHQLLTGAAAPLPLVAPEHLVGEVANGLRKRAAQGALTTRDALAALTDITELDVEFVGGPERWARTLEAALEWSVTTYDALYVLLAVELRIELVTADLRLVDSARRKGLPVRPLVSR